MTEIDLGGGGDVRQMGGRVWRATLVVLAVCSVTGPEPLSAQQGATFSIGPVLARRADRDGGPDLGKVGAEARVFLGGPGGHAWGLSAGYYSLGRFPDPSPGDYFDERVLALGPRVRWTVGTTQRVFTTLGVDVLMVEHDDPRSGAGRDPAVGAFAGFGYYLVPPLASAGLFLEGGVHALAATGELTDGSGYFGSLALGISF